MKTKELKLLLGCKITEYQQQKLPASEILKVNYPYEIDNYKPKHPVGEYLLHLNSADFARSKNSSTVVQDKDTRISVYTVVKSCEQGRFAEEYTDILESALSGLKINSNRGDKLVFPEELQFIKEENRYCWYETIFVCPSVNIQEIPVQ